MHISLFLFISLISTILFLVVALLVKRLRVFLKSCWQRLSRIIKSILLWFYNKLINAFNTIINCLLKIINWLEDKKEKPNLGLKDFSPSKNADKEKKYSEILKWALENKSVKNLALSGPYGSGKSSIIQTFQKRHPEYHYLNISLAAFNKSKKKFEVELVLLSILQQIFYYVKSKSMPDSRYRRIDPLSKREILVKAMIIVIWGISIIFLVKREIFNVIPNWDKNFAEYQKWISGGFITVSIVGAILVLFYFLKLYNNSKLNKLNIASGELQIEQKGENSILNKHLDEILYFFEISRYDVVILEDLDRFEEPYNTEILMKLRELSTLINNAQQIGRHVTFVYAIKEELFKKEDRTKFFDFIIPVIPVINSSNSADLLTSQLKEANLIDLINKELISDMAVFITDMRMLVNILNEFLIYKKTIGQFDLIHDNLLAMIIYKNLEPDDFAMLQKDKGNLYSFINGRQDYNEPLLQELNEQHKKLEDDINILEESVVKNIAELRLIYVYELLKMLPNRPTAEVDLGDGYKKLSQLTDDESFNKLRILGSVGYTYITSQYSSSTNSNFKFSFKAIEQQVDPELDYDRREAIIKIRTEHKIEEKKRELQSIQQEIDKVKYAKIKELVKISPAAELNPIVKDKELTCYLLEKGYIDEEYRNYISYFYAESMTNTDRNFVLGTIYNRALPFNYKLEVITEIVKKLTIDNYSKAQVLNLDLINYLLQNHLEFPEQLEKIFAQLSKNQTEVNSIRESYLEYGKEKQNFIYWLVKSWPNLWQYIELESNYPANDIHQFLLNILNYAEEGDISKLNENKLLSSYIGKIEDFNTFSKSVSNTLQLQKTLKLLDVKFELLSSKTAEKQLFNFIHQNNLYALNQHMIKEILEIAATEKNISLLNLNQEHYTTIIKVNDVSLVNYLHNNLDLYVNNVFLEIPENLKEKEESILSLLNNESLDNELKNRIIIKEEKKIGDLTKVDDTALWEYIVSNDKMNSTWYNISEYFKVHNVNETLGSYINIKTNFTSLSTLVLEEDTDILPENQSDFIHDMIISSHISDEALESILPGMVHEFEDIDLPGISDKRVDKLIEAGFLMMNKQNYNHLKTNNNGKNITLLEHFIDNDPDLWKAYTFDASDYNKLFLSNVYSLEQKIHIADTMPINILNPANPVAETLSKIYSSQYHKMTYELFNGIILNAQSEDRKVIMFNLQMMSKALDEAQIKETLSHLGPKYADILEQNKFSLLFPTTYNVNLASILEKQCIISSVTKKDELIKLNKFSSKNGN